MKKLFLAVTLFALLFVLGGNSIVLASDPPSEGYIALTATAHDGDDVVEGTCGVNIIKNYTTVAYHSFDSIAESHTYYQYWVYDISYAGNPDHWQSYWHRNGSQYLIDTRVMQTGILTTLHDHEY